MDFWTSGNWIIWFANIYSTGRWHDSRLRHGLYPGWQVNDSLQTIPTAALSPSGLGDLEESPVPQDVVSFLCQQRVDLPCTQSMKNRPGCGIRTIYPIVCVCVFVCLFVCLLELNGIGIVSFGSYTGIAYLFLCWAVCRRPWPYASQGRYRVRNTAHMVWASASLFPGGNFSNPERQEKHQDNQPHENTTPQGCPEFSQDSWMLWWNKVNAGNMKEYDSIWRYLKRTPWISHE